MAVKQKSVKIQNLNQFNAFIEESGAVSEYFNITDVPDELPLGKSSLLLMGSQYLKENVTLKLELIDNIGNPVYLEPVYNYKETGGIRVGLEIYNSVAAGAAELVILGEIDPAKVDFDIPSEFQGVYNVKYSRPLTINKAIPNTRPIKFYKRPIPIISEIIKGQITPSSTTTGSNVQTTGTIVGLPATNTEGNSFQIDSAHYGEIPTYTDNQYGYSPIGNTQEYVSPNDTSYLFSFPDGSTTEFSSSMVGGTLTISSPQATPTFVTTSQMIVPSYSARISKVVNKKTIRVQKPFGLYDSGSGQYLISPIEASSYQINWPKPSEFNTSSVNFKSFANVVLSNVRTFSGDVYRIAAYVKNNGPFGNWNKVIDTPVEAPELLQDTLSLTGTARIGYFASDTIVSKYWNETGGGSANPFATSTVFQTYSTDEYLVDSVFISSSAANMLDGDTDHHVLALKPQYSMSFAKNTSYTLTFDTICDNRGGIGSKPKMTFFMSGSAFTLAENTTNQNAGFGRAIAQIKFPDSVNSLRGLEQTRHEATFEPDFDGTAILQIKTTHGHWHLANLSLRAATDTNFSPDIIQLTAPVPALQTRPDNLDFAFEFYNSNNEKSETVITTLPDNPDGVVFQGENMNILGNDNTIEGSIFIGGETTGSGIQMGGISSTLPETGGDGATGSGFIRSVQYRGFKSSSLNDEHTGWMIYSGSVLPDSGDNYAGVGLELAGKSGSLRFSTIPSRFEVVADAFFVGNTNTQFISGSGGIIEISSSAFHLSSSGDVVVSGSITATSGDIGNWKIVDGMLSGSNATLDANGSALYKSDQGPDTNPNDGYYIDFTPGGYYVRFGSDFAVSSSGTLIASGAIIEGVLTSSAGYIGNWTIGSDSIHKSTGGKYSGLSSIGNTRFFAGADSLSTSGSAPFNVKSSGDVSASNILLGNKSSANYLEYLNGALTVQGTITANAIRTPAIIGGSVSTEQNASASINAQGFASFKSASIAGFEIAPSTITSTDDSLILKSGGEMTGSSILLGNKGAGQFLQYKGSTLTVQGDITANNIRTPATIGGSPSTDSNASSSINTQGFASFKSASIGGFEVSATQINSTNDNLILKSNGQITASAARIVGSDIDIDVENFELDTTGLELSSTEASMSLGTGNEIVIRGNSNSPYISIQPSLALPDKIYGDTGIMLAVAAGSTPLFSAVGTGGHIKFNGTSLDISTDTAVISGSSITLETPKFFLGSKGTQFVSGSGGSIEISSSAFHLTRQGNVTASQFLLEGGKISGSNVEIIVPQFKLDTTRFDVDSEVGTLSLGAGVNMTQGSGVFFSSSGDFKMGDPNGNIKFSEGSFSITGSDINIDVTQLNISASGFTLSSPQASMSLGNNKELLLHATGGTGGVPILKMDGGEISSSNFFLSTTGEITGSAGKIGGWTIGNSTLSGTNITLDSSGTIQTADYSSGVKGWKIDQSGEAEFENATIRGTLATVTFEKESINAVGGQLWVANSTAISGSTVGVSAATMSVVNASGFVANEYLIIKKETGSGFNQEVVKVVSSSITGNGTNDFAGNIMVTRAVSGSATTYEEGQVIVSTGVSESGYIRINANPSDAATPYIDIVERTGSAYPDFELKARLGDLSGISSAKVGTDPGFGLFSENVFLTGKITATSGEIGGYAITSNAISSSNDKLILKSNGQITGSNVLFTDGKIAGWNISSTNLTSPGAGIRLNGNGDNAEISVNTHVFGSEGIQLGYNSGNPRFYAGDGAQNFLRYDTSNGVSVKTTRFELDTTNLVLSSTESSMSLGEGKIKLIGQTVPVIKVAGGEISASNFFVSKDGNLTASNAQFQGELTSSAALIGGWTVDSNSIQKGQTILSASDDPGLYIQDAFTNNMVTVASSSLHVIGSDPDEMENDSFEVDPLSSFSSAGYHVGTTASPLSVVSWSIASTGPVSHSITKRSGAPFTDFNEAVLGDFTLDIVHPGTLAPVAGLSRSLAVASQSYLAGNTYEVSQIVSASSAAGTVWKAGNVVSFAGVGKFSHSLSGKGYDRGLQSQKYKVEYWNGSSWTMFIPKSGSRSDRGGYAQYRLGSRYGSISAGAELPANSSKLKVTLSGSINPDTSYKKKRAIYQGHVVDPMSDVLPGKTAVKEVEEDIKLNDESSAKYPYTEITFDNFRLRQSQPRVQLTPEGFLLYASDSSYLKMTPEGIDFRGGQGFSQTSTMLAGDSNSDNIDVYGSFAGPSLQAYEADTADVGASAFQGNVGEYAMGNHRHKLNFSTINDVLSGATITNGIWNSNFGAIPAALISGSWQSQDFANLTPAKISGSWQSQDFANLTPAKISGSWASSGAIANSYLANDGITIAGNDISLGGTITSITILNGTGVISQSAQLPDGLVSSSAFSSPSQGTIRATLNGSTTDVDSGLQSGDSPQFTDLTLTGNLTVQGTQTIIDSTTLNIGDNIIELNAGTSDGGLYIKETQGGAATGSLLWDVSANRWIGGLKDSEVTIPTITSTDTLTNKTINASNNTLSNIPNSALTNTSVSYGGISIALGSSDATPAFDLSDATSLPIVAGTTGTLSVARGGIGATSLTDLITLGSHTTGNYMTDVSVGTGLDVSHTPAEGSTATVSLDLTEVGFGGGANRIITDDADGTVSTEANLTFSSPLLTIGGGSAASVTSQLRLAYGATDYHDIKTIYNGSTSSANKIIFALENSTAAATAEVLTLRGDGTIGINQTAPSYGLDVTGTGRFTANVDFGSGIDITGDITVTGTVDGRDVATDGTKLDGIESSATADQTASEILTAIKTVDGTSSGLDADLLDGQEGTYYLDFTNITVTSGEVSNAMLANSSVSLGGISVSLGSSDATPAFDLSDATSLPLSTGTTGTLAVGRGGTGTTTLTDGGILLGSGTGAITAMSALADGQMIVGDGSTDPVAESGATLRTSIGVGLTDSPQFTNLTLTGNLTVEGSQTIIDSTTLNIGDRIIELNAAKAAGDGGLYVRDQSTAETGSLLWDVDQNRWIGGLKDSEVNLVTIDSSDTLTNKTLTTPTISATGWTNANHTHAGSTTGGQLAATAISDFDTEVANNTAVAANTLKETNVTTNLSVSRDGTKIDIVSSDGTNAVLPLADTDNWGVMSDEMFDKLDGIETSADVTDATNVEAAGALMDSELTSIADVKALNQSVVSGATPTFTTTNFTDASNKRLMTDAQETLLDSVETNADVTDATNVEAAGALMDSEVDADIKTLSLPASTTISTFGASLIDDAAATNARTTLGLIIGTDVQAFDDQLASVAGWTAAQTTTIGNIGTITTAADKMIYTTAADTFTETAITSFGRSILDDADEAAFKATVNLEIGTDVQAQDAGLASISGLTTAADKMIYTTAADTYAVTGLTSFGRSILDDADEAAFKATVNLEIGTDVQAQDAGLASIAGLTTAADKMVYTTAADTYAVTGLTSFGRSILDDANEATFKATVNLEIGTDVQAYHATLDTVSAGTYAGDDSIVTVGTIATGEWNASDIALGTYTSGNYVGTLSVGAGMAAVNADGEGSSKTIAVDGVLEDLDTLGAAASDGQFIVATGAGTFGYESTTVARTSLGVGTGDSPSFAGLTSTDDIILDGSGDSIYNTFVTGMFGTGWSIDYGANGSSLEIDNIVVRNTLRTHIFQKDTVKASNGALYISDSGVINSFTGTTGTGTVSFKDDKSATFVSGSTLWYKDAHPDTGTIASVKFGITDNGTADTPVADATQYAVIIDKYVGGTGGDNDSLADLVVGGTAVRISGGSLLLDASSTAAPFMDVIDDAGNTRVRVGQVKQSADYDKYGILGMDGSGNRVFEISEQVNEIAGWSLTTDAISKSNISLNATNPSLRVTDGTRERVRVGDLNGVGGYTTAKYGVIGFDGTGVLAADATFELSNERNMIAGWDLIPGNIQSDNSGGSVRLSSTAQALTIWTGSINEAQPKLVLGKLPLHDGTVDNPYGFAVFSGSGTVSGSEASASVLITANKARLAGWELGPGQLTSGTVATIDGNQAKIALGTNATTHTGMSPSASLFFVSASADPIFFVGENFSYIGDVLTAGGWTIGSGVIESLDTDGGIKIDASNKQINIYTGSAATTTPRIVIGDVNGSDSFGIKGVKSNGNTVFEISETQNIIAGWTINAGSISKNNVKLDSTAAAEGLYVKKSGFSDDTAGGFLGLDSGVAKFNVGNASKFIKFDGNHLTVEAGNFSLDSSGNVTADGSSHQFGGTITANVINATGSGVIGGFGITDSEISSSGATGNTGLRLKSSGQITASAAKITGDITATGGTIGGFTIGTNLTEGSKAAYLDANSGIFIGADGIGLGPSSTGFYVSDAGVLVANSATIAGTVTATNLIATNTGSIAGWDLRAGSIEAEDTSVGGRVRKTSISSSSDLSGLGVQERETTTNGNKRWQQRVKVGSFALSNPGSVPAQLVQNKDFGLSIPGWDESFKTAISGIGGQKYLGAGSYGGATNKDTYNATHSMAYVGPGSSNDQQLIDSSGWDRFVTYVDASQAPDMTTGNGYSPHWSGSLTSSIIDDGGLIHNEHQVMSTGGGKVLFVEPGVVVMSSANSFSPNWGTEDAGTAGMVVNWSLEQDIGHVSAAEDSLIDFKAGLQAPPTNINIKRLLHLYRMKSETGCANSVIDYTTQLRVMCDRDGGTSYDETLISTTAITLFKGTPDPIDGAKTYWTPNKVQSEKQGVLSGSLSGATLQVQLSCMVIFGGDFKSKDMYDAVDATTTGISANEQGAHKVLYNDGNIPNVNAKGVWLRLPGIIFDECYLTIGGTRLLEASSDGLQMQTTGTERLRFDDSGLDLKTKKPFEALTMLPNQILFNVSKSLVGADGTATGSSYINPTIGFNYPAVNTGTGSIEDLYIRGMRPYASTSAYSWQSPEHGYSAAPWSMTGTAGAIHIAAADGASAEWAGSKNSGDGGSIYLSPGKPGAVDTGTMGNSGSIYLQGDVNASNNSITASHFVGDGSGLTGLSSAAITTAASMTNNYVLTATGATAVTGESKLQFDGSNLGIGGAPTYRLDVGGTTGSTGNTLRIAQTNNGTAIRIGADTTSAKVTLLRIDTQDGNTDSAAYGWSMVYRGDLSGVNNRLDIMSDNQSGTAFEALTILQDGKVGISDTAPGKLLDVAGDINITGEYYMDDTEIIDSNKIATGLVTRQLLPFGHNSGLSVAGTSTTIELTVINGATNGKGYRMMRAGSITAASLQMDCTNSHASSTVTLHVYKNGSSVFSPTMTPAGSGDEGLYSVQAVGVDTFVAGDQITAKLYAAGNAGTVTLDDVAVLVEISTTS